MVSQGCKRINRSMFERSSDKNKKGAFPGYPASLFYVFLSRIFCEFFEMYLKMQGGTLS